LRGEREGMWLIWRKRPLTISLPDGRGGGGKGSSHKKKRSTSQKKKQNNGGGLKGFIPFLEQYLARKGKKEGGKGSLGKERKKKKTGAKPATSNKRKGSADYNLRVTSSSIGREKREGKRFRRRGKKKECKGLGKNKERKKFL